MLRAFGVQHDGDLAACGAHAGQFFLEADHAELPLILAGSHDHSPCQPAHLGPCSTSASVVLVATRSPQVFAGVEAAEVSFLQQGDGG